MKPALKFSVLLNLLLLTCLFFISTKPPKTVLVQSPSSHPAPQTSNAAEGAQSNTFRWSHLESTNYLAYIQNLRDIGCPAQTLRDIITADVGSLYANRAKTLRQESSADSGGSDAQLQAALQKLDDEKAYVLNRLLGADPNLAAGGDSTIGKRENRATSTVSISMPLVWQDVDSAQLKLDSSQTEAVAALRQSFMDKIGGANQDPGNPGYRERWEKAQPQIDGELSGLVGRNAYLQYQVLAASPSSNR